MTQIISIPFGWIMNFCYMIVRNYGVALILFTLITKILLYPLAVKQQKSTMRTAALTPKLNAIKKKYGNNKEKINEETMNLYNQEGINPMGGCLPLLIQLPILWGLYGVIYSPLTHILRLSKQAVADAQTIMRNGGELFSHIVNNPNFKNRSELFIMQAIKDHPDSFSSLGTDVVNKVQGFNNSLFGINLGDTPTFAWNILLLIPIISFLSNILLTLYSQYKTKQMNPGAQQMGAGMNAVLFTMPVISAIFAFQFPAGVGLYWIISTLFSLLQSMLLYKIYTPERIAEISEKEKKKKKNRRPSMYERALAAQQMQNGTAPSRQVTTSDSGEEKLSKAAMKEFQRQKLNEARKRFAEKYGDEYKDDDEK